MQYYSLNQYLREKYGRKVYKLALSASETCPNRDGALGFGGCTFCSAGGSGDFAETDIDRAKARIRRKTSEDAYIAYYQSYTGTYGDLTRLRSIYEAAMARDRKSTRLNSSHTVISYAVFCLKKIFF